MRHDYDDDAIILEACDAAEATLGLFETDIGILLDDAIVGGLARAEELAMQGALSPAYVAAEYAAAGKPLDDAELAGLYVMGQRELLDEIIYLADYQA